MIESMREFVGTNQMMAYLVMMAAFGPHSFRNEIVWQRTSAHNDPQRYGANKIIAFL